jgi:riboflavin kinase/FMN adenylyltransferase
MTIGTCDEVHTGHEKPISSIVCQVKSDDGVSAVDSFLPYPTTVITFARPKPMTYSVEQKYEISESYALDSIIEQFSDVFKTKKSHPMTYFQRRKLRVWP